MKLDDGKQLRRHVGPLISGPRISQGQLDLDPVKVRYFAHQNSLLPSTIDLTTKLEI